jgi:signal transduction histidine kinase
MPPFISRLGSPILIKALLGTSALVAASVVSLSGLFLLRHQAAFQRQFELRAESLAVSLAGQSQFALLLANRAELERMARTALAESGDVLYVIVEDASGNLIAGAERAPISRQMLPGGAADIKLPAIRNVRVGPGAEPCVEASVPVIPKAEGGLFSLPSSPAEVLGRIRVGLSLQSQQALFLTTLRYVMAIALLILLAASAIDYVQIRRLLRPLVELAQVAKLVGQGSSRSFHAVKRSDDEIGVLVDSFNEMVDQVAERTRELHEQVNAKERARAELVEAQQRLIELSRQSGMAEVATNVLHNVGNILNSVNVSATVVANRVKDSRVDRLVALVDMLQQHSDGLEEFLRRDPKGQRVLPYLDKLGSHMQQERQLLLKELEVLTGHIGHIKRVVATQQDHARVFGLIEDFSLSEIVEDAVRILESAFERNHVALLRDFEENPKLSSDKHQVLQIILNLLRNAEQAMADTEKPGRLIRVRIRRQGEDRVRLEVKDSGAGLAPENLTRIFAHGFTTKSDGHGFGLHSGALSARQLGGSLWAESEGPGLGATFTLELPLAATTAPREKASYEIANLN